MFQELRHMRKRLTLYYTLVLILFTSLFVTFVLYNIFYFNKFMLDRELKFDAGQVSDLSVIPQLQDAQPGHERIQDAEKNADSLFKFILRDEKMYITRSSVDYEELGVNSQKLAQSSLTSQKERWDTILLEGNEYRFYSIPFQEGNQKGVVQTYCNLTMVHRFAGRFTGLLIIIGLAVIIFAALLGWWLAGRAMMPVRLAWQRQKEFIADVSHELRTPLTIIQSNLDVVVTDKDGTIMDNSVWLQNAYNETKNMGKLINDLLLLARFDSKEIEFDKSEFNLSNLLTDLGTQFMPLFQGKNQKFSSAIESDICMYGDEIRIRQMVGIFLDNANKYTPENGHINLIVRKLQNVIDIQVIDNGIGFDESEKEKVFRRFYRIDKARSRKQGGTGLGLAIAAWIADEHKAIIHTSSKPGVGSIFKVIIPIRK